MSDVRITCADCDDVVVCESESSKFEEFCLTHLRVSIEFNYTWETEVEKNERLRAFLATPLPPYKGEKDAEKSDG